MSASVRSEFQSGIVARNAVLMGFLLMGLLSMGWVPRIPEIKDAIGLSNSQFGFILLGSTFGSITGAQLAGRFIHMYGSRRVTRIAVFIMPLGLATMGLARTGVELFIALVIMGIGYTSLDMSLNFQGVVVEKILKRRWLSTFHAMWSVGAFLTTIFGGAIARHIDPRTNLLIIAGICLILFIPSAHFLLSDELDGHSGEEEHEAKIELFSPRVKVLWMLGIAMMGSMIAEGAASDWSAILLRDNLGFGKGVNASAFASFALAMIVARFLGDKTLDRFGLARTVKMGGYLGALGWGSSMIIAMIMVDSYPLAALVAVNIGFAIAGFGIGPMFPALILASTSVPGMSPAVAMSRVGVIGMAGFFVGPSVIGLLADMTSLPIAMGYPLGMLALTGFLSRAINESHQTR